MAEDQYQLDNEVRRVLTSKEASIEVDLPVGRGSGRLTREGFDDLLQILRDHGYRFTRVGG